MKPMAAITLDEVRKQLAPFVRGEPAVAALARVLAQTKAATLDRGTLVLQIAGFRRWAQRIQVTFTAQRGKPVTKLDGKPLPSQLVAFGKRFSGIAMTIDGRANDQVPSFADYAGQRAHLVEQATSKRDLAVVPHFIPFFYQDSDFVGYHRKWTDASGDLVIVRIAHDEDGFTKPSAADKQRHGLGQWLFEWIADFIGTSQQGARDALEDKGANRAAEVVRLFAAAPGDAGIAHAAYFYAAEPLWKAGDVEGFADVILAFARFAPDA